MWHTTVRSLLAHKLRLLLTALAVVIGVAFVSGTMVLTDTLHRTFDELFGQVDRNTNVAVRSTATSSGTGSPGTPASGVPATGVEAEPVPAALLPTVRAVPGVREATGDVSGYAQLVRPDGRTVTTTGPPTLGVAWSASPLFSAMRLERGRGPQRADESRSTAPPPSASTCAWATR